MAARKGAIAQATEKNGNGHGIDQVPVEDLGLVAPTATKRAGSLVVVLPPLKLRRTVLRVCGDSLLCTNSFSAKAQRAMLDKMQGKVQEKKAPRDPEADFESSKYLDSEGHPCVRAISFKAAAVSAASQFDKSLTKVFLRGVFHVPAEFLRIDGECRMREDVVRVGIGTADLRYRAEFYPWSIDVPIRYNSANISVDTLVELFRMAGFSSGIGEYRPERDGAWGMFSVSEILYDREDTVAI